MPFRILFEKTGKPISQESIKKELSTFSKSYDRVVKTIIDNSANLSRDIFNFNVATLMPTFGMTRTTKSVFYGMRIEKGVPVDSIYHVLNVLRDILVMINLYASPFFQAEITSSQTAWQTVLQFALNH